MEPERLRHTQREQQETQQTQSTVGKTGREFGSVEEMLREDAAKVSVPDGLEARLRHSLAGEPVRTVPWWKRWFRS